MNLLKLIKSESNASPRSILILAVISGIANGILMAIINAAAGTASHDNLNFRYLVMFVLAIMLFIVTKKAAMMKSLAIAEKVITQFRLRIANKLRHADLQSVEQIDHSVIEARLTQDTMTISQASGEIINALQSAVMILVCVGYLAMLSFTACLITVGTIVAGVSLYLANQRAVSIDLQRSTEKEVEFFHSLGHLVHGFKELKMNQGKSGDWYENSYTATSIEGEALKIKTAVQFVRNFIFSQTFFYMLIGVVVFLLPVLSATYTDVVIKTTAVILFIIGPLTSIVGCIPFFVRANVAVDNLYRFEAAIDAYVKNGGEDAGHSAMTFDGFQTIAMRNLAFQYVDASGQPGFSVGPFDLTWKRGETVFIVGGNGSGKSTLMKLLTGLYQSGQGELLVDGIQLRRTHYQNYRELFSIIFTDFHLFDRLYGLQQVDERRVREMLRDLELTDKTDFVNGRFTNTNLSTGQRKRLAFIIAMLDDRPILAIDEFAADQDPVFRAYFYNVIFKDLKARGKTVIAVTHDDKYFGVADRVLKMEYGRLAPV